MASFIALFLFLSATGVGGFSDAASRSAIGGLRSPPRTPISVCAKLSRKGPKRAARAARAAKAAKVAKVAGPTPTESETEAEEAAATLAAVDDPISPIDAAKPADADVADANLAEAVAAPAAAADPAVDVATGADPTAAEPAGLDSAADDPVNYEPVGTESDTDEAAAATTAAAIAEAEAEAEANAICGEVIFPLPSEAWMSQRVQFNADSADAYERVLSAAAAVADDAVALAAFAAVNRDLLDYRFSYRLTAERIQARNEGDVADEEQKRELLTALLRHTLNFDKALFPHIGEAEGRLAEVLSVYAEGKKPSAASVVMAAGSGPNQIFAFWLVVVAAVAAWETRLVSQETAGQAQARLTELEEIREVLEGRESLIEKGGIAPLIGLMRLPNMWAPDADREQAKAELLSAAADEAGRTLLVRRLGCMHCQLQRHSFAAYQPIVSKLAGLCDVLLLGEPRLMQLQRTGTKPRQAPFTSRLMEIAADADNVIESKEIEIHW